MYDLQNNAPCNHLVIDYPLSLDGISPNYYANLLYPSNKNTNDIDVREWGATEGMTNYSYNLHGMTNWSLNTGGTRINFNTQTGIGVGSASFVDGSTMIYPPKKYVATYNTLIDNCPKCSGTGRSNDINIEGDGSLETLRRANKIRQQVRKAVMTLQSSNAFHEGYGSVLSESIGSKLTFLKKVYIQKTIQDAINYLIESQGEESGVPVEDLILRISDMRLEQDQTDPRKLNIQITVTNGKYEEISTGVKVSTE